MILVTDESSEGIGQIDREWIEVRLGAAFALVVGLVIGYVGYQANDPYTVFFLAPTASLLIALLGGMHMGMSGWGSAE